MSAPLRIAPADSIAQIAFTLGYHGGELPIFVNGQPNPAQRLPAKGLRAGERLARIAQNLDHEHSAEVAVGLPTIGDWVHHSTVLWAWVGSGDQLKRASAFTPRPSIVLKIGSAGTRLLLWGLRHPIPVGLVEPHNSRIAYALHAARTRVKPEQLRVPLPGTFVRVGRSRAAPILTTRLGLGSLSYEAISGELRDPPPRDAWRERISRR